MSVSRTIGCALARWAALPLALACASKTLAIDIIINPGPALSANPAALAAFNRAAAQWESRLSDPVTITVNADIAPMANGTAMAQSVYVLRTYNNARSLMIADAADEGADDGIVASLPTFDAFAASAVIPQGAQLNGGLMLTKANLKALGVTGLDTQFGQSDGTITFNSSVAFDYDNSDGVGGGLKDFESAAMHEIGHTLGFHSAAGLTGDLIPGALDLFRFQNGSGLVDPTTATFATTPRFLLAGSQPIFDDGVNEWGLSNGIDGFTPGHWKSDDHTGIYIGVMEPSIGFGQLFTITAADLRVFDLIGYEAVTVPGPGSLLALGLGIAALRRRRRSIEVRSSTGT